MLFYLKASVTTKQRFTTLIPGSETSSSGHHNNPQQPQQHQQQQQRRSRAGRVRTVLTEKQLQLLKSCYHANPRPDALMKEQLVEMTGLNPRVVRVWFQNKRCKDKKKMQMKQSKVICYILLLLVFFKKWAKPGLFFYFRSFQTHNTFFQNINVKKCPSSAGIRTRNLLNLSCHP